jgi:hypothetical protein
MGRFRVGHAWVLVHRLRVVLGDLLISGQAFNARRVSMASIMIHCMYLREPSPKVHQASADGGTTLPNNHLHPLLSSPVCVHANRDRAQNPLDHRLSLLGALTTKPPGDSDECVNAFCLGTFLLASNMLHSPMTLGGDETRAFVVATRLVCRPSSFLALPLDGASVATACSPLL